MSKSRDVKAFEAVIPSETATPAKSYRLPKNIKDGERHLELFKVLRSQKARGLPFEAAVAAAKEVNRLVCTPPLPDEKCEWQRWWDQPDDGLVHDDRIVGLDPTCLSDARTVAAEGRAIAEQGISFVVEKIVPAYGMLGMLVAYAKAGKTTMGFALAGAVARGVDFIGLKTTQARVLVIAAEDPPEYTAYAARHIDVPLDAMTIYRKSVILDSYGLASIAAEIHNGGYGLVLISSWQAVIRGLVENENDNAGAVLVVENVKAATRLTKVPWLIDAHSGKGEDQTDEADPLRALRGASSAAGAADFMLSLRYAPEGVFSNLRRLSGKGRFVLLEPQTIAYDINNGEFKNLGTTKDAATKATWKAIQESRALTTVPQSTDEIARAAGLAPKKGKVSGGTRRKVKNALYQREGVVMTKEMRGGHDTTLYNLSGAFAQIALDAATGDE